MCTYSITITYIIHFAVLLILLFVYDITLDIYRSTIALSQASTTGGPIHSRGSLSFVYFLLILLICVAILLSNKAIIFWVCMFFFHVFALSFNANFCVEAPCIAGDWDLHSSGASYSQNQRGSLSLDTCRLDSDGLS